MYAVYAVDYGQTVEGTNTIKFGKCRYDRLYTRMAKEIAPGLPYDVVGLARFDREDITHHVEQYILGITKEYQITQRKRHRELRLASTDPSDDSYAVRELAENLNYKSQSFDKRLCVNMFPRLLNLAYREYLGTDISNEGILDAIELFKTIAYLITESFSSPKECGKQIDKILGKDCDKSVSDYSAVFSETFEHIRYWGYHSEYYERKSDLLERLRRDMTYGKYREFDFRLRRYHNRISRNTTKLIIHLLDNFYWDLPDALETILDITPIPRLRYKDVEVCSSDSYVFVGGNTVNVGTYGPVNYDYRAEILNPTKSFWQSWDNHREEMEEYGFQCVWKNNRRLKVFRQFSEDHFYQGIYQRFGYEKEWYGLYDLNELEEDEPA